MPHSIADRISEAAARAFVGRRRELEALDRAVGADGSVVLAFVHGPGGIGKTCLVDEALRRAPPGVRVLRLDCRQVEPTARGLLAAVWAALGGGGDPPGLDAVAGSLRGEPGRTVLVLDNYEVFGLLDAWVRQEFLPALPDRVVAVISGRDPPAAGWLTAPGWAALVERVEVRGLRQSEALELLRLRGLSELQAARVNAFARGHPLALELAAATPAADRDLALEGDPPPEVLGHLVEAFVAQLPAETLRVVEAASTVRRVDEPILRALLEEPSARDAFEALRRLPFAESTAEGLALHDVVRDVVARDLALRDPEAHAGYRRRAFELFVRRVTRVGSEVPWTATADLVFLIRNPLLRDCCFPPAAREYVVEPATAQDGAAIRRIAAASEPAEAAAPLLAWLDRYPETFSVARGRGGVAAFTCLAVAADVDPALLAADPVGARWTEHLRAHPLRSGERVLLLRRWLGRESGEAPSAPVGACWLDLKRAYLDLRPHLRRLYSVVADLPGLGPIFLPLGFAPLPGGPVVLGGVDYHPVVLDFGEDSVDGWLGRLIGAELLTEPPAPDPAAADGLSPREVEVLRLLADGASNRAIAEALVISEKTAARHVANLFAKLGVHSRAQAARIAAERGLTAT